MPSKKDLLEKVLSYDKCLFVDESGNEDIRNIGKDNVSHYYIVGAIVIEPKEIDIIEKEFEKIATEYFQKEMKSKHIKGDLGKRIRILNKLFLVSDYIVHILVVNKKQLSGGFEYPKSFIKNIQLKLYNTFRSQSNNILIITDQIKRQTFNDEFEKYIYKNIDNVLWARREKITVNSKDSYCIQAIDVITGSILRCSASDGNGQNLSIC